MEIIQDMTVLRKPIVVISDVHLKLGSNWAGQLDSMRGLWSGAAAVVFNGDTMNSNLSRDDSRRQEVVDYIRRICREDSAEVMLIGGNSDSQLPGPRHVSLSGGRILVLHGDVIFKKISPWRTDAGKLFAARRLALQNMPPERRNTLQGQSESVQAALHKTQSTKCLCDSDETVLQRYIHCLSRPWKILLILWCWMRMPRMVAKFADKYAPQAEMIIVGHSHHNGIWLVGGKTIINTGSLEGPGKAMIARIGSREVTLQIIKKQKGLYIPGKIAAVCPLKKSS